MSLAQLEVRLQIRVMLQTRSTCRLTLGHLGRTTLGLLNGTCERPDVTLVEETGSGRYEIPAELWVATWNREFIQRVADGALVFESVQTRTLGTLVQRQTRRIRY